jgi:hypothetical protein
MTSHEPHMNLTKRGRTSQKPHRTVIEPHRTSKYLTKSLTFSTFNLTRRHREAFTRKPTKGAKQTNPNPTTMALAPTPTAAAPALRVPRQTPHVVPTASVAADPILSVLPPAPRVRTPDLSTPIAPTEPNTPRRPNRRRAPPRRTNHHRQPIRRGNRNRRPSRKQREVIHACSSCFVSRSSGCFDRCCVEV